MSPQPLLSPLPCAQISLNVPVHHGSSKRCLKQRLSLVIEKRQGLLEDRACLTRMLATLIWNVPAARVASYSPAKGPVLGSRTSIRNFPLLLCFQRSTITLARR